MKETDFFYWFGMMFGGFLGFGTNVIWNYGTHIGNLNLIFATIFLLSSIGLVINHVRKLNKEGKNDE